MRQRNEYEYNYEYFDVDKARRFGHILLIAVTALLLIGMLGLWISGYYSQKVFQLDGHDFKLLEEAPDGTRTYQRSGSAEKIRVMQEDGRRTVVIGGEAYVVDELPQTSFMRTYRVTYPSGSVYTVEDQGQGHWLRAVDADGTLLMWGGASINGERQLEPGEEYYYPTGIVTAAYEDYHSDVGLPILLIPSLFCLALGWLELRSERFVLLTFKMSYGLWVENPEPTDFYLFMSKVGGWVLIGVAVALSLMSL